MSEKYDYDAELERTLKHEDEIAKRLNKKSKAGISYTTKTLELKVPKVSDTIIVDKNKQTKKEYFVPIYYVKSCKNYFYRRLREFDYKKQSDKDFDAFLDAYIQFDILEKLGIKCYPEKGKPIYKQED